MNYLNQNHGGEEFNPKDLSLDLFQIEPIAENLEKYHSFCKYELDENLDSFGKKSICNEQEDICLKELMDDECCENKEFDDINNLNGQVDTKKKSIDEKCTKEKCSFDDTTGVIPYNEIPVRTLRNRTIDSSYARININDTLINERTIDHDHQNSENQNVRKRFGRDQDRDLFNKLKIECILNNKDIKGFWKSNGKLDRCYQNILAKVFKDTNYKGTKTELLGRIRKIGLNTKFSVRERKLIKSLVIQQIIKGQIDYAQLEYNFPGKSAEMIKNEMISMLHSI